MSTPGMFRAVSLSLLAALVAACTANSGPDPAPGATTDVPAPASTSTTTSAPTPQPPTTFPLAVVTGLTNLKAAITVKELRALADAGTLITPCGVELVEPALAAPRKCLAASDIEPVLRRNQKRIALLPPGLVQPSTKVLSIAGDGPFGMFGPDLFGDTKARALDYPVTGSASADDPQLDPAWLAYDPTQIWTMTNLGSLCSDRGAATQAVARGKGWDWVFEGGTAEYAGPAVVDPPDGEPYRSVNPVDTGNDGAMPEVVKRSDVAIADHECPVVPTKSYKPQLGRTAVFSVPEEVLPRWTDTLGVDIAYLAANHMSDKGVPGIRSTLELLDKHGVARTGMGMDLDEALEPAYVDVAGLTVGVVAFNDVAGVVAADEDTPGVAWITKSNIDTAVKRARDGGADLVVCAPQWWGGAEYHDDLWPLQEKQLGWFDGAGCDHVIGSGTHVAGPISVRTVDGRPNVMLASPGNYLFGQDWWQETQEGVVLDLTFRGTELVNVRLRPTVMILQARPALLDPEGDGKYVLQRMWKYAEGDYVP